DDTENAGFTTGKPWLKVAENANEINVQQALQTKTSIFYFYQKLIALRKDYPVIQNGDYTPALTDEDSIIAYTRSLEDSKLLSIHNFASEKQILTLPSGFSNAKILLSNYQREELNSTIELSPYETLTLLQ
ncbi:oligo-1,6-glucosidase, partial [Listeria ivanovii FSL F6-596]